MKKDTLSLSWVLEVIEELFKEGYLTSDDLKSLIKKGLKIRDSK